MKGALALAAAAALAALGLPAGAGAKVIRSYPNFNSAKGIQLNGSAQKAQVDGAGRLRLTSDVGQAGSAFTQQKLISTRKSFAISFRTLLHEGSDPPADGLTFTILKGVPTALGEAGSGLGYGGIPGRSLAIEHDIFNACCDPDSNHVGLLHYGSTLGEVVARTVPFPLYGQLTRTWFVYAAKKKLLRVSLLIKQP